MSEDPHLTINKSTGELLHVWLKNGLILLAIAGGMLSYFKSSTTTTTNYVTTDNLKPIYDRLDAMNQVAENNTMEIQHLQDTKEDKHVDPPQPDTPGKQ